MVNPYCKQVAGKRIGMTLLLMLAALILAFAFVPRSALADEETDSGSDAVVDELDPFEFLPLSVTASTDGLPDDQVQITVVDTNEVGMELVDHSVSFKIPDGWTLVSGSISSDPASTKDGESVSTVAVLVKGSSGGQGGQSADGFGSGAGDGSGDGSGVSSGETPKTGDPFTMPAVIIAIIVVAAVALFSAKKLRFHSTLSVVVSALLIFSLLPAGALQAIADEVKGTQPASGASDAGDTSSNDTPFSFDKTVVVDVRGESLSIDATVSCSVSGDAASDIVNLELKRPIPVGASSANVTVLSEVAYAGSSENMGQMSSFDVSKIELSGSLEGAIVRKGAYTVKVQGKNEQSTDLKDRTHYELRFIIDDIAEGVANADSDHGYIELTDQPFADENQGYGIACVSYSESAGSIAQVTSDSPMGDDAISHTFDNGKYFDGTNRFRVPVDLDGIEVGMPIPTTSEFAAYATGDTFTIDGVEYRMFTSEDIVRGISFNVTDYKIEVVECTEDLGYTWLTFQVNDATGADAYKELTDSLANCGVLFGGQITSTYKNTIVYPDGSSPDATGASADPFAYAETSPVAFAWAAQLERDSQSTKVTYLAALHSSQEADGGDETGDVDLLDTTTFSAYKISTSEDGTSKEIVADNISVSPYDAGEDVLKIQVSIPNDLFDEDAELFGLSSESDNDDLFDALYTYLGNVNLRMTGGSTNTFGAPEKDIDVALFDGESFQRANAEDEAGTVSLASVDSADSAVSSALTKLNPGDSICRYTSLVGAVPVIAEEARNDVDGMNTIYRKGENDSQSDAKIKTILSDAVQTGLGINHGINIVRFLGKNLLNYATAGFTIVGFIGVFVMDLLPKETGMYSIDDVMNKLDSMNNKLDTVETTVNTINVKLDEQSGRQAWQTESNTYTNLKSLLCSQTTSDIFQGMDNVLGKYMELDADGKKTTTPCSRSTSISRMPKEAIDALDAYLGCVDGNAKNKGFENGIASAYTALHNILVPGTADSSNILDIYYEYVNTKYNWDVETKAAKRAFLASFMVMYNNAYALYSAKLGVELYKAQGNDALLQGVNVSMKELQNYSDDITTVLYGKVDWAKLREDYPGEARQSSADATITANDIDTEKLLNDNPGKTFNDVVQAKYLTTSSYIKAATDTDSSEVRFIATDSARQRTYSTNSYALSAAYDESCFAWGYVTGVDTQIKNTWKPTNSFELDELRTMANRLNNLPSSMRPTITDSSGTTRPVESISEEMEALGFKMQQPNTQFKKQLLNINTSTMQSREEKIIGNGRASLWANNGNTTEVWATVKADDANPADEVDRYSDEARNWNYFFTEFEYNIKYLSGKKVRQQYAQELSSSSNRLISSVGIGNKISDPQDYIVLSASDCKGGMSKWGGNGYGNDKATLFVGRYGTVFNLKTGETTENQLLYAVEVQAPFMPWMSNSFSAIRCEYYAFGVLNVTENGRGSLMSDYAAWYQTNWYAQSINDGNYAGSQNNSIDIRRYNKETD